MKKIVMGLMICLLMFSFVSAISKTDLGDVLKSELKNYFNKKNDDKNETGEPYFNSSSLKIALEAYLNTPAGGEVDLSGLSAQERNRLTGNPDATGNGECRDCSCCLGNNANCEEACLSIGKIGGTCAIPWSTDPGQCCACQDSPTGCRDCSCCLGSFSNCEEACQNAGKATGECGVGWSTDPSQCCICYDSVGADCGNGAIDSGEQCDGINLNGKSCTDFGFTGGTLNCYANCEFNKGGCTGSGGGTGTCSDDDAGRGNPTYYFMKGNVTKSSTTSSDECVGSKVKEYSCGSDGNIASVEYDCPGECSQGKCLCYEERTGAKGLYNGQYAEKINYCQSRFSKVIYHCSMALGDSSGNAEIITSEVAFSPSCLWSGATGGDPGINAPGPGTGPSGVGW